MRTQIAEKRLQAADVIFGHATAITLSVLVYWAVSTRPGSRTFLVQPGADLASIGLLRT